MNSKTSKALTPRKKLLIWLSIFLVLLVIVVKFPWAPWNKFKSAPFSGTIIDKETKQPIEGGVVLVVWPRMTGSFGGASGMGVVEVKEAITDSNGNYHIPGWEKKQRGFFKSWFGDNDPTIYFNKKGYWPKELMNDWRSDKDFFWGETWESDWDGKTIELAPAHPEKWNPTDWKKYLDSIKSHYKAPGGLCDWLRFPYSYIENDRMQSEAYAKAFPNESGRALSALSSNYYDKEDCEVDQVEFLLQHGMNVGEIEECCISRSTYKQKRKKTILKLEGVRK